MSCMTKPGQLLVFYKENPCRTNLAQVPCVFSGEMCLVFDVTATLDNTPQNFLSFFNNVCRQFHARPSQGEG